MIFIVEVVQKRKEFTHKSASKAAAAAGGAPQVIMGWEKFCQARNNLNEGRLLPKSWH